MRETSGATPELLPRLLDAVRYSAPMLIERSGPIPTPWLGGEAGRRPCLDRATGFADEVPKPPRHRSAHPGGAMAARTGGAVVGASTLTPRRNADMDGQDTTLVDAEARLSELWERMVQTIGIHTVSVLMDRAIWDVSRKHPELALIQHSETGLSFAALNRSYANQSPQEVVEAFSDLSSELMIILARLLGQEMAQRLAAELEAKMPREKRQSRKGSKSE